MWWLLVALVAAERSTYCPNRRLGAPIPCTECAPGHFVTENCSLYANNKCANCTQCAIQEFEVRPCTRYFDRVCALCPDQDIPHKTFGPNCTIVCNPGYYFTNNTCVECEPGYQCNNNSKQPCDHGLFNNMYGQTSCQQCTDWLVGLASTACALCDRGSFVVDHVCTECASGTYQGLSNASSCFTCPANHYCNRTDVNACPVQTESPPGSFAYWHCRCAKGLWGVVRAPDDAECLECPANTFCDGQSCV